MCGCRFEAEQDEISQSRKISWDLATRFLERDIFFYISSPSRNSRFDGTNSRSRLKARDVEDTNLDLVSNHEIKKILISSRKKNEIIIHIFHWNLLCNNFEALFFSTSIWHICINSFTYYQGIFFPNTIITPLSLSPDFWRDCLITAQCIETSRTKLKVALDVLQIIFSESSSSGDVNDWDQDLQKDKYKEKDTQTKTETKCFQAPIHAIFIKSREFRNLKCDIGYSLVTKTQFYALVELNMEYGNIAKITSIVYKSLVFF